MQPPVPEQQEITLSSLRNWYPTAVQTAQRAVRESTIATTPEGTCALVFATSLNTLLRDVLVHDSVRASMLLDAIGGPSGNEHRSIDIPGRELALYAIAEYLPGTTDYWIEEREVFGNVQLQPVSRRYRVFVDPLDQTSNIRHGIYDQSASMLITDSHGQLLAGVIASVVDDRLLFAEKRPGGEYSVRRLSYNTEGNRGVLEEVHVEIANPAPEEPLRVGILGKRMSEPGSPVHDLLQLNRWKVEPVPSFGGWALLQLPDCYHVLVDLKGQPRKEMQWAWMALFAGHPVTDLNGNLYEASDFERMALEAHAGNMEDRFPYLIGRNAALLARALSDLRSVQTTYA